MHKPATAAIILCSYALLDGTASAQDPLFTVVQISDSQPKTLDDQLLFELVLDTIAAAGQGGALLPLPIDVVFFVGDLVDDDNESEWITWVQTIDTRLTANGIPFHAVPGNHDQEGGNVFFYEQYVADDAVWNVSITGSVGHNGIAWTTAWNGLRFIGFNNSNGGDNQIDPADVAQIDSLVTVAAANNENVFLVGHHRHDDGPGIVLASAIEYPGTVGYMHGHAGPPFASQGLSGVDNPNVWRLNSNAIFMDGAILYYEVFVDRLEVYVIELINNPTGLPSPETILLVHDLTATNPAAPVADFSGTPTIGEAPLDVSFIDLSTNIPTMWNWTFGDGYGWITDQHPIHTYELPGTYDVTLAVSNDYGGDALTIVGYVTVEELTTATLLPVGDTRVKSTSPDSNYGTEDYLRCRDGMGSQATHYSYLQFDLTGLESTSVSGALLRLFVTDGSNDGGTVFGVDSDWTETGLTYATAPPFGDAVLGSNGDVYDDTWIELDVSDYVRATSVYSFGIRSNASNSVYFSSREGANPPELVVELDQLCIGVECPPGEVCAGGVCEVLCGNGVVNLGEDCANCPQDVICAIDEACVAGLCEPLCGNGVADPGEDCASCPQDVTCPPGDECIGDVCALLCGNGVADPGEHCANCPQDVICAPGDECVGGLCQRLCGNGVTDPGEDCASCPQDVICAPGDECVGGMCQRLCGNGVADPGENCANCPQDVTCAPDEACIAGLCEPLCGNGVTDPGEDCASCPQDVICAPGDECVGGMCLRLCGNGVADPGEDCASCPQDVICAPGDECVGGMCLRLCGNGVTDPGEDCASCPQDVTCAPDEACIAGLCEPLCGNGSPDPGEDCASCPQDVTCAPDEECVGGVCEPLCGNGSPDPGEDCANCPLDVICLGGEQCAGGVCQPLCWWDLTGDDDVGINDFLLLLGAWGSNPGGPPDFDGDGDVDIADMLSLLAAWGACLPG